MLKLRKQKNENILYGSGVDSEWLVQSKMRMTDGSSGALPGITASQRWQRTDSEDMYTCHKDDGKGIITLQLQHRFLLIELWVCYYLILRGVMITSGVSPSFQNRAAYGYQHACMLVSDN